MFQFLRDKLLGWRKKSEGEVTEVVGEEGRRISEKKLEEVLAELETVLFEADVAQVVVEDIQADLRKELEGKRLTRELTFEAAVEAALRQALERALTTARLDLFDFVATHQKPVVLLFLGVNGTGKTTIIAKLAHHFKKRGMTVVLAAGDTFRAGAQEQIEVHATRLDVKLVKHEHGADPAAVAFDAIEHARARKRDVVLIDTAGRMGTNANLMDQMKKIKKVAQPHLTIFVGDALAGNDAVDQAKKFNDLVGFDGAILTKIDADAKGGAALSITRTTGKPILFVGTGQGYEDLQAFDAKWLVDRLFGPARPA